MEFLHSRSGTRVTEPQGTPLERMHALSELAGFNLSTRELEALKPMWDHYANLIRLLHEAEVDEEDLAVSFSADWSLPG